MQEAKNRRIEGEKGKGWKEGGREGEEEGDGNREGDRGKRRRNKRGRKFFPLINYYNTIYKNHVRIVTGKSEICKCMCMNAYVYLCM